MNNVEIYFLIQNIMSYIVFSIIAIVILLFIGAWIYDNWLYYLIKKIKEKTHKKHTKGENK